MATATVQILRATTHQELKAIHDAAASECIALMTVSGEGPFGFGSLVDRVALANAINRHINESGELSSDCSDAAAAQASVDAYVREGTARGVWIAAGMAFIELLAGAADDLTRIRGIGPKTAAFLNSKGIVTFSDLGKLTPAQLKKLLAESETRLSTSDPTNWPKEARRLAGQS